jgi:predicted ABC-type ATPase
MWIIAGPNGAGKSSFKGPFLERIGQTDIIQLNADEVTASLRANDETSPQDALNLAAARLIDAKVEDLIQARTSFLVETVLSSGKYRDDLDAAKAAGFKLGMVYGSLYPAELSPGRVSERALKGGHVVDPGKAVERYYRSHAELAWFAPRVDTLMIFDNSARDGAPVLIARKVGNALAISFGLNPAVDEAWRTAFPDSVP